MKLQQFSLSFQHLREMSSPVAPDGQGLVFSCPKAPRIEEGLYFIVFYCMLLYVIVIDSHKAPVSSDEGIPL